MREGWTPAEILGLALELPVRATAVPLHRVLASAAMASLTLLSLLLGLAGARRLSELLESMATHAGDGPLGAVDDGLEQLLGSGLDYADMAMRHLRAWHARLLGLAWLVLLSGVAVAVYQQRVWPLAITAVANGCLVTALREAGQEWRARGAMRRRALAEPAAYLERPDRIIALTVKAGGLERSSEWSWNKEFHGDFPKPKRVLLANLVVGDWPDENHEALVARSDLLVIRCEARDPSWTRGRVGFLSEWLERRAPNPFRINAVLMDGHDEEAFGRLRGAFASARRPHELPMSFLEAGPYRTMSEGSALDLVRTVEIARARRRSVGDVAALSRCVEMLHPACGGVLRSAIASSSDVESSHLLLDFWEAWLRVFCATLAALETEGAAGPAWSVRPTPWMAELLEQLEAARPTSTGGAVLARWYRRPSLETSCLHLLRPEAAAWGAVAPGAGRLSPAQLLDLVRGVRNRFRHGAMVHQASEYVRRALLADFLALHCTQLPAISISGRDCGEAPKVRASIEGLGDFGLTMPGIRFGRDGWEHLVGDGAWRPFQRGFASEPKGAV